MSRKPSLIKSGVKRSMPKHHFFRSILQQRKTKKHRSQVGAMEDEAPSSRIVRVLVIILLLHILFIGGVCLQGHLTKTNPGVVQPRGMSLPPQGQLAAAVPTVESDPAATPGVPGSASRADAIHITDASTIAPPASAGAGKPAVVPSPAPADAAGTVRAGSAVHLVRSGETWSSIAIANGCSEADLKAVNPQMAGMAQPMSGERLAIPAKPGETVAVAAEADEASDATFYVLQKNETLSKVARMHKTSVAKLMSLNKLTEKDARRLRPGTKLQVSGELPVADSATSAAPERVVEPAPARTETIVPSMSAPSAAAPAPAATPVPSANGIHVLKKGETIAAVARQHGMSLSQIMALNKLTDKSARRLQPGAKIKIAK